MTLLVIAAGIIGILGFRAGMVFLRKNQYANYWQQEISAGAPKDALRLVVLGDSISQGVGASRVEKGLVGRVARHLRARCGKDVAIKNYSRSGATAEDVAMRQLPLADFDAADVVLLEIGANDTRRLTPEEYERYLNTIIATLPLEKTVIADVPFVSNREAYQEKLDQVLKGKSAIRAHFVPELIQTSSWKVTAGDFFHPNDKGYELWFKSFKPGIDEVLEGRSLLKEVEK